MSFSIHSLQSSLYGSADSVGRTQGTMATQATSAAASAQSASAAQASSSLHSAALSSFGQFLSKVQSLSHTDPAKAKGILGDIANKLKQKSQSAASSDASQRLQSMADKFAQAAQTGDLSALQPQARQGGSSALAKMQAAYSQASGVDQSVMDVLNGEAL